MNKRGFTLIELLVTIAVITLLMLILLPILKWAKHQRLRATCKNNFRQIGVAMYIYGSDYDDEMPRAAGPDSEWGSIPNWQAKTAAEAFGLNDGSGRATISASLYLLVKYSKFPTETFVCPADTGATPFEFRALGQPDLADLWDFGPDPSQHVSYAYHMPYNQYPLTFSGNPGLALAADRNPWLESPGGNARPPSDLTGFDPGGTEIQRKQANSLIHLQGGQNVLSLDTHVEFYAYANCGVKSDNIYTSHNGADIQRGTPPTLESQPADPNDSLLLHDPPKSSWK